MEGARWYSELKQRRERRAPTFQLPSDPGPGKDVQKEGPDVLSNIRAYKFWQQPTLTKPYVSLPSAAEDFTAVFGMGTGGTPRLWSPEIGIPTRSREKFQSRIIEIVGETNARKNILHQTFRVISTG